MRRAGPLRLCASGRSTIPWLVGGFPSRLAEFGARVGVRMLELLVLREKNLRRETRIIGILSFIHTTVFRALFGKPADSLERSNEREDECTHNVA